MLNVDRKLFHKALCLNDKLWNRLSKIISLQKRSSVVGFEKSQKFFKKTSKQSLSLELPIAPTQVGLTVLDCCH